LQERRGPVRPGHPQALERGLEPHQGPEQDGEGQQTDPHFARGSPQPPAEITQRLGAAPDEQGDQRDETDVVEHGRDRGDLESRTASDGGRHERQRGRREEQHDDGELDQARTPVRRTGRGRWRCPDRLVQHRL
jgi:hypothetical protein